MRLFSSHRRYLFIAPVLINLLANPASAVQWECGERSNLPQEGKNYCAAGDFRHTEIKLQKMLEALIKDQKMSTDEAHALRKVHGDFESARDNQCEVDNKHNEDKPFHPMVVAQCKTRLNNLRLKELGQARQVIQ